MKKISAIFLILFLILFTALIKNSTKRIDDEIFIVKENIRFLKKEIDDLKLEYTYLSSSEKLMDYKARFFNENFSTKKKEGIKILKNNR
tara:strand:+ start:2935 stop:3201 length:267 start_codon:yes stop_codon:yes gene_type:complete